MKWLRYQRVISLETYAGITIWRSKWTDMDFDGDIKGGIRHPSSTGHTSQLPSSVIMNESFPQSKFVRQVLTIGMKNETTGISMEVHKL
jgi:hypothetical protein